MNKKGAREVITLSALAIAFVHILFPNIKVDGVTVALLLIAIIPWLGSLFKAIELPGGLKVEYRDLLKAEKKAADAGLLAPIEPTIRESRYIYPLEAVAVNDPNLALAGLRIEIESRLRDIASSRNIIVHGKSTKQLIQELRSHGVLNRDEISAVDDLLPLLNRAAHGAEVDGRASRWALDVGTRILHSLEEHKGETTVPQLLERWRKRDGAAVFEVGTELSKAFVKSPLAFLRAMKGDSDSFSAWLEGMGNHTFTIFESRSEVEDYLYMAYYEKLKALMENAARESLKSDCGVEAERVLEALSKVKIRRI
jgi:hypothetical protein